MREKGRRIGGDSEVKYMLLEYGARGHRCLFGSKQDHKKHPLLLID
jgi:hypothetical protein